VLSLLVSERGEVYLFVVRLSLGAAGLCYLGVDAVRGFVLGLWGVMSAMYCISNIGGGYLLAAVAAFV
jgi:hypothetical protein